jgi:biopolymer transport protein ExbB
VRGVLDVLIEGGILVIPLLICGAVGLILSLERLFFWLKQSYRFDLKAVETVYMLLSHRQFDEAQEIIETSKDPSLMCLKHCLASKGKINGPILQSLALQKLEYSKKFLKTLEIIINISPLLGILGTVLGIIDSVSSLKTGQAATQASFDSQVMISGLSEALVTTALGLIISISCTVTYGYFQNQWEILRAKLERDLTAFESLTGSS